MNVTWLLAMIFASTIGSFFGRLLFWIIVERRRT